MKRKTWHQEHKESLTPGDRIADAVATFIGSWTFIIVQSGLLAVWAIFNTLKATHAFHFDEFPFVFMNLFMSAEAAFSTPLILMSSNRAASRDRVQAQHDYDTNTEAEKRIETLQLELSRIEEDKLDRILKAVEKNSRSKAAKVR